MPRVEHHLADGRQRPAGLTGLRLDHSRRAPAARHLGHRGSTEQVVHGSADGGCLLGSGVHAVDPAEGAPVPVRTPLLAGLLLGPLDPAAFVAAMDADDPYLTPVGQADPVLQLSWLSADWLTLSRPSHPWTLTRGGLCTFARPPRSRNPDRFQFQSPTSRDDLCNPL